MENIKDTYVKYQFIINYISKVGKKRILAKYGESHSDLNLAGETELLTILLKGYPIFTKNVNGYELHLIFRKKAHGVYFRLLEANKSKLVAYLNQSTRGKQNFTVTCSVFLPYLEKDFFQEYHTFNKTQSAIDKATKNFEKFRQWEKEEQRRIKEIGEQAETKQKTRNKNNGIIDPFGKGWLITPI
ncbi:hypothetical protein KGF86_01765 [Ornithinibacillus massiliensis]|uniref:Uncharacterized protein n=1 Tax=Ornithinibacillus massiliensis TaxID=1944633 RepID=A0ABS5M9C9_9BACI|nr:hypothetical protein [Ornithinibacillus massiliensis]MBS3678931.1 hypothetical protein [Ornithinibacillus massiliensis]